MKLWSWVVAKLTVNAESMLLPRGLLSPNIYVPDPKDYFVFNKLCCCLFLFFCPTSAEKEKEDQA